MPNRRLKTAADSRRFIANVINRLDHGELDPGTTSKLGYLIGILLRSIESSSLENRIERLESQMEK